MQSVFNVEEELIISIIFFFLYEFFYLRVLKT